MPEGFTPRRRHSSLFQRMEEEINKISRKISIVKSCFHKQSHSLSDRLSPTIRKPKEYSQKAELNLKDDPLDKWEPIKKGQASDKREASINTVKRRRKSEDSLVQFQPKKVEEFNHRNSRVTPKQPLRKLRFSTAKELLKFTDPISQVYQQNSILSRRLRETEELCEDQSYKIGYLKAQNADLHSQFEHTRMESAREKLYLTKLLECYKIKAGKYKQMLGHQESVSIGIEDV